VCPEGRIGCCLKFFLGGYRVHRSHIVLVSLQRVQSANHFFFRDAGPSGPLVSLVAACTLCTPQWSDTRHVQTGVRDFLDGFLEDLHPRPRRGASHHQSGKKHKFYVRLGGLATHIIFEKISRPA
jgi:hypothetical protein